MSSKFLGTAVAICATGNCVVTYHSILDQHRWLMNKLRTYLALFWVLVFWFKTDLSANHQRLPLSLTPA
jgi:hypothetical protein